MMKAAVLAVLLFVSSVLALSEPEYQNAFLAWTKKHNKAYASTEFSTRYTIFKSTLDFINQHNAQGSDLVLALNHLSDLTNAEYRKLLLGTKIDASARLAAAKDLTVTENVSAASSVDWVSQGAVTAIKDQGQCGSCWSFSTTGSVEGIHYLKTKNLVSLSEQNLIDCSGKYGNQGCDGGLMDNAFQYIIANKGIDTEASYPYTAAQGTCHYKAADSGATIDGYTDVKSGSESALQTAATNQPISVAIDASSPLFQSYSSGVYYVASCSSTALDHGVLVVGFGTSGSSDYWLVKNSWGTTWGQEGYIWMARNRDNNCGIATMASFPTIKN